MTEDFTGPVLVVGAHPDDPEFGGGGTVAVFGLHGQDVHYVVCTDGSRGTKDRSIAPKDLAAVREREQRAAAEVLGVESVTFLHQDDGGLQVTADLRRDLARIIRQVRPHVMITHDPWRPYQLHPDHRAAGFLATDAFVAARDHLYHPELYFDEHLEPYDIPEIWFFMTAEADHFVDITEVLPQKIAAIACHSSQLRDPAGTAERLTTRAADIGKRYSVAAAEEFKRLRV
jgi:LmbE family N-acetylglucosaminyl deacetylase